jgi:hypothetical protein
MDIKKILYIIYKVRTMNEIYKIKDISLYYEENEIPYHYIWYYIDEKTKKKVPIGEYNKAIKKTVEQKLYKQNMEGMKMTVNQENKIKNLNENEKNSIVISYTSFLKHTKYIYCIDIDDEGIKSTLDLPEEFGKIRLSGYIKGNTKGIHIYIKILNMIEYENQQDVIKLLKGDLIRENNIWEKIDKKYNYNNDYEEIMEFEWNDIKHLFNEEKMNLKKNKDNEIDDGTIINQTKNEYMYEDMTVNIYKDEMSVMSDITESAITDNILYSSNKELVISYIFEELFIHNVFTKYKNWLNLCFCIYNEYNGENEGYKLLIKLCSKLSNYNENECFIQYNKYTKKSIDKKVKIGTLRYLYYEYFPDKKPKIYENIEIDYSEKGMSELFLKLKNNLIVYQEENLYIYYNNEWRHDKKGDLCKYVISNTLIFYILSEIKKLNILYNSDDFTEEEKLELDNNIKLITKFVGKLKTIKFIGEILKQIQSILSGRLTNIIFDLGEEQKYNIHFKNGVYDLKNKYFRQRKYDDYITQYLDYDYMEKHEIEEEIHNFVIIFYKKIQPIESERDFMLGYLAYCLTGNMGKQIFKVNIGYTASNGKSTEMAIHDRVFPIYTKKLKKETFNKGNTKFHKFVKDCLNNPIRLVYLEELDERLLDVDVLKDWVDGRKITIEILFGTDETKTIQAKLMTCSNKDINIKGDQGLYRRGRLQFYNSKFEDINEDDYINHIYKKIENLDNFFDDVRYKNAYFHLLLNYVDNLKIPKSAINNFKIIVDETDDLFYLINDNFEITKNKDDKLNKKIIEDVLFNNKWNDILIKLKSMGVIYDREHKFNGERGVLYGIVKKINNDILIKDFTNDIINDILYNINI